MSTPPSSLSTSNPVASLRRSILTMWAAVGVIVGAVIGFVVASVVGLVVGAVLFGVGLGATGAFLAGRFVESAIEIVCTSAPAREIDSVEAPRLFNLLQGLCASAGVAAPRVSVTDDDAINALVVADPSRRRPSELIVTRGFLDRLERIEMEGAVAVCLARLRSGLVETQTLAVALSIASPWFVPGVVRRGIVDAAVAGQLVFDADVKGVGITRYPPGLAAAFQKMLGSSTRVGGASGQVAVLWLANPLGESEVSGNDVPTEEFGPRVDFDQEERPPLSERLALLREI